MRTLFGDAVDGIKYYWTLTTELDGIPVVISRTGWTAEVGYEIYLRDPSRGGDLWDRIMDAGRAAQHPADRAVGGAPHRGRDLQLRLGHDDREQPVRDHGPGAPGRAPGRRLHRQGSAGDDSRARRPPQARRDRVRGRRAAVRDLPQARRPPRRRDGRHGHRPDLVAAARQEHRLRLGPVRALEARHGRSRSRRPTAGSGRRPPPRSRSSTRARTRPSHDPARAARRFAAHRRRDRRRPQAVPGRLAPARPRLPRPTDPRVRAAGVVPARLDRRRAGRGRALGRDLLHRRARRRAAARSPAAATASSGRSSTSAATAGPRSSRSRAARPSASSARTTPGSTTSRATSSGPSTPTTSTTSRSIGSGS